MKRTFRVTVETDDANIREKYHNFWCNWSTIDEFIQGQADSIAVDCWEDFGYRVVAGPVRDDDVSIRERVETRLGDIAVLVLEIQQALVEEAKNSALPHHAANLAYLAGMSTNLGAVGQEMSTVLSTIELDEGDADWGNTDSWNGRVTPSHDDPGVVG